MIDLDKYQVISFDMFQTLVDVNSRKDEVLKAIFGDSYEAERADREWTGAIRPDYVISNLTQLIE